MKTYIILLRAVNVSGKNIIKMAELKKHLENNNFRNVKTYIQSGNIVLQSDHTAILVQQTITEIIKKEFQLGIQIFVLQEEQLDKIINENPFPSDFPNNKVYVTFLETIPTLENTSAFQKLEIGEEQYKIIDHILYFYVPEGMSNSKLSNPFIESKLKLKATGRNLNTINKLKDMLSALR